MEQLGRYRLQSRISAGGMGELFLARQEGPAGFAKTVAIKRLLKHLAQDLTFVELFLNEARLAALLSHPNVVQIFDLGETEGAYFIAMEYVHGRNVRALLQALAQKQRLLPPAHAVAICIQALQGLSHAHRRTDDGGKPLSIVHRDVSPENLLVSFEGTVKVVDFGLANAARAVTRGELLHAGKLPYMAPEQLERRTSGPAVDLYALGAVLYELLAGTPPFTAAGTRALRDRILEGHPAPPGTHNPAVPASLDAFVLRALSRMPEDRFASAEEMAQELERCVSPHFEPTSAAELGRYLVALFPDAALGQEEAAPAGRGTAVLGKSVPLPPATSTTSGLGSSLGALTTGARARARALRSRRGALLGLGTGALLLLGVSALLFSAGERPSAAGPGATAPAVSSASGDDLRARPPPEVAPTSVVTGAVTGSPAESADSATPVELGPPERVAPSRPPSRAARLPARGKLEVLVNPWADVFVAGKHKGTTPLGAFELESGRHRVLLKNGELGVSKEVWAQVRRGQTTRLKVDLLDEVAKLRRSGQAVPQGSSDARSP